MRCALTGISKVDVLKEIGNKINDYYLFISEDGIFNWFDLNGNYIENSGVLKELKSCYLTRNITKCIIPDSVTSIGIEAFSYCKSIKENIDKRKTLVKVKQMVNYPFGIKDESVFKFS